MIELEHSPLGASGANRWFNCEGSFLLHRDLLESGEFEAVESDFASLGTAAHELASLCLTEQREPWEYNGRKFGRWTVGADGEIDPEAVSVYVNECESIWPRDGKGTALIERTLHHPEVHPLLKGTVDFGYWSAKRGMHLRDYKNGVGVGVAAPNNKQLLYYGFLMMLESPWLKEAPDDFPVTLGVVQPNFYGLFEAPDVWETKLGVVRQWGFDDLLPRMTKLTATRDIDDSDFISGAHCQFCPVMLECPKAQAAFKAFADGEDFIEMLTNEELDRYAGQKPLARKFMNALDDVIKARLIAGAKMENMKLVEKQTKRVWKPGAAAALEGAFGDLAYDPKKIKSPAAIEKLSSRGKDMAKEWGYKPDADALTIAGVDDPRPPAVPQTSNAKVFGVFEQSNEELGW
jgi:hypothetical protein